MPKFYVDIENIERNKKNWIWEINACSLDRLLTRVNRAIATEAAAVAVAAKINNRNVWQFTQICWEKNDFFSRICIYWFLKCTKMCVWRANNSPTCGPIVGSVAFDDTMLIDVQKCSPIRQCPVSAHFCCCCYCAVLSFISSSKLRCCASLFIIYLFLYGVREYVSRSPWCRSMVSAKSLRILWHESTATDEKKEEIIKKKSQLDIARHLGHFKPHYCASILSMTFYWSKTLVDGPHSMRFFFLLIDSLHTSVAVMQLVYIFESNRIRWSLLSLHGMHVERVRWIEWSVASV